MYNTTAYDNATTFLDVVNATNSVSDGYFFALCVLLVGFIIIFVGLKSKYETATSFIGASFIISIVSVGGWALGLVSTKIVFYPIILLIGSIIVYMIND